MDRETEEIMKRLTIIEGQNHHLLRLVQQLSIPVEVMRCEQAAKCLGVSAKTLKRWAATGIFTDARPLEKQRTTVARVFFADEIEAYRGEGEAGVRRVQKVKGRPVRREPRAA